MTTYLQCALLVLVSVAAAAGESIDCNLEDYYGQLYADLTHLTRPYPDIAKDLNELLVSTHNVVSYAEAWDALAGEQERIITVFR